MGFKAEIEFVRKEDRNNGWTNNPHLVMYYNKYKRFLSSLPCIGKNSNPIKKRDNFKIDHTQSEIDYFEGDAVAVDDFINKKRQTIPEEYFEMAGFDVSQPLYD